MNEDENSFLGIYQRYIFLHFIWSITWTATVKVKLDPADIESAILNVPVHSTHRPIWLKILSLASHLRVHGSFTLPNLLTSNHPVWIPVKQNSKYSSERHLAMLLLSKFTAHLCELWIYSRAIWPSSMQARKCSSHQTNPFWISYRPPSINRCVLSLLFSRCLTAPLTCQIMPKHKNTFKVKFQMGMNTCI